ncbi:hypothetical protein DFO73_105197 [Cytobacillus oceanisediminis]|jgi:hypothetical protein|uniref:Uncharacterized protein n=1 Tax=Cytobacillus oceanisediminis TaxID=665099 RepID=A0A2V2ZYA9_9BACI|nr:hypothetical protein DFO73_105197 [Cytobacillus oceanisediminis]
MNEVLKEIIWQKSAITARIYLFYTRVFKTRVEY